MAKFSQTGFASIYNDDKNASGAPVNNKTDMTAAHRTLPFGTKVKVTRLKGKGEEAVVTIQDRGPFVSHRIIDLRPAAARAIGLFMEEGVTLVKIETIGDMR